jgi:hypothetical protein
MPKVTLIEEGPYAGQYETVHGAVYTEERAREKFPQAFDTPVKPKRKSTVKKKTVKSRSKK